MNRNGQMHHATAVASNGLGHGAGGGGVAAPSRLPPATTHSIPSQPHARRVLWKKKSDNDEDNDDLSPSCIQDLEERYLMRPNPKSFWEISNNAIVVAQEFSLTCYFLLRYRLFLLQEEEARDLLQLTQRSSQQALLLLQAQRQSYVDFSTLAMSAGLMLVVYFGHGPQQQQQQQSRKHKVRQRLSDALLLAVLLRLLAGVLRTLTASYASDTVTSLVYYGMMVHLLFCDYDYANGQTTAVSNMPTMKVASSSTSTTTTPLTTATAAIRTSSHGHRRPPFQGGTLSLNAAFFATVVAISRLESNMTAYLLCSLAVIMFAFYPASRHAISVQCQQEKHAVTIPVGTSSTASPRLPPPHAAPLAPGEQPRNSWLTFLSSKANVHAHWIISTFVIVAVFGLILALEPTTMTAPTTNSSNGGRYRLMAWFGGIWLSLVLILPAWKAFVLQNYKRVMRPGCPWDIPTAASMLLHYEHPNANSS